jgi:hypothetical protein
MGLWTGTSLDDPITRITIKGWRKDAREAGPGDPMSATHNDLLSLIANSPLTKSGFVDSVGRSGGWAGVAGWRWDARAIDKAN